MLIDDVAYAPRKCTVDGLLEFKNIDKAAAETTNPGQQTKAGHKRKVEAKQDPNPEEDREEQRQETLWFPRRRSKSLICKHFTDSLP